LCQKEGHMQQECYSRIKKNAPCVDRYGKPIAGSASWTSLNIKSITRHITNWHQWSNYSPLYLYPVELGNPTPRHKPSSN
jgi:hypothetical protein